MNLLNSEPETVATKPATTVIIPNLKEASVVLRG